MALLLTGLAHSSGAAPADPSSGPPENPPAESPVEAGVDSLSERAAAAPSDVSPIEQPHQSINAPTSTPFHAQSDESIDESVIGPFGGAVGQLTGPLVGGLEILRVEIARFRGDAGERRMTTVSAQSLATQTSPEEEFVFTVHFINPQIEPAAGLALVTEVPDGFQYVAFSGTGPGAEFTFSTDGGLSFHEEAESDAVPEQASHLCWRFDVVLYPNTQGLATFRAMARELPPDEIEPGLPELPAQAPEQMGTSDPDASDSTHESDAARPKAEPAVNADSKR